MVELGFKGALALASGSGSPADAPRRSKLTTVLSEFTAGKSFKDAVN